MSATNFLGKRWFSS